MCRVGSFTITNIKMLKMRALLGLLLLGAGGASRQSSRAFTSTGLLGGQDESALMRDLTYAQNITCIPTPCKHIMQAHKQVHTS